MILITAMLHLSSLWLRKLFRYSKRAYSVWYYLTPSLYGEVFPVTVWLKLATAYLLAWHLGHRYLCFVVDNNWTNTYSTHANIALVHLLWVLQPLVVLGYVDLLRRKNSSPPSESLGEIDGRFSYTHWYQPTESSSHGFQLRSRNGVSISVLRSIVTYGPEAKGHIDVTRHSLPGLCEKVTAYWYLHTKAHSEVA